MGKMGDPLMAQSCFSISEVITSTANPRIKTIASLSRGSRSRREEVIVIEGVREISRALDGGFPVRELYVYDAFMNDSECLTVMKRVSECDGRIFSVSDRVMEKISYRETRAKLLAVADRIPMELETVLDRAFARRPDPVILVMESPEKPGNVGAVLRTCDGAGVDGVIVCDPSCDPLSANGVRSSLGCVFTVPCCVASGAEAIAALQRRGVRIIATTPAGKVSLWQSNMQGPTALALGSEKDGLTDQWLSCAHETLVIPMRGHADSLNLSTSAAIVVFEAMRQRP
ncbi:MAG: rRNA methyltransferase [Candidatus Wallbacteria bacterium HGW-Wallbacteria-1]|jgi:TrmH family RNA methyltransferase|uniref:rRNA methyltransferase n=1 Tax=Candidatus Wallbacteria bacterium HGW-Wallbacteria-1 TaxID=2013854 RepID=A0A2N1PLL3_9BACT|nr:MAG: rRNA methyltransferase [Candidatus Wallbacteria bacterium HGW-Wallbacteria-1]